MPIKAGNEVVAGVGLSGSPGVDTEMRDGRHRQGEAAVRANSEWRIANSESGRRGWRFFYSLFATRYSLLTFLMLAASPAAAIECAPYCDYTHDYGPYDLTWKRPGLYAFPVCAPDGECAPRAVRVYSPVSGWPYRPYRGVRITVRPRTRR